MQFKLLGASLLLICVVVVGCKTQVHHTPNPTVLGDTKAMLFKMLSEQTGLFQTPLETTVADDGFVVTWMFAQGMPRTVTVYYTEVARVDIVYRKHYVCYIKKADGSVKYTFKTADQNTARLFIDVLFTLKQKALNAPPAPAAQPPTPMPTAGCNPPCSPGYQCVGTVCQPQCNPPCAQGMICGPERICQPAPPPPPPGAAAPPPAAPAPPPPPPPPAP